MANQPCREPTALSTSSQETTIATAILQASPATPNSIATRFFGQRWTVGLGGVQAVEVPVPESDHVIAFVAADCCLSHWHEANPPTPAGWWGQGRYRPSSMAQQIKDAVSTLRAKRRVVVLVLHFPPVAPGEAGRIDPAQLYSPSLMLNEYSEILDLAEELKIRLFLSGHIHRQECFQLRGGSIDVWCASTACARSILRPPQHMAHIMKFTVNRLSLSSVRVRVERRNFLLTSWNNRRRVQELLPPWAPGAHIAGRSWTETL